MSAEEKQQENDEIARQEDVTRRHLCFCPEPRCERRLTRLNSVSLPETDCDAYAYLRTITPGPESLRYDLLRAARRLK
jgi:hypothetical protein